RRRREGARDRHPRHPRPGLLLRGRSDPRRSRHRPARPGRARRRDAPAWTHTRLVRLPAKGRAMPLSAPGQVVLVVDFTSAEGRTWWAVGVGDTHVDAIAFAQDSCPTDTIWRPLGWNDLYGD